MIKTPVWIPLVLAGAFVLFSGLVRAEGTPTTPAAEATISSDELEMQDNGAVSIFKGHVVLTQEPYVLLADRMVRTKATGVVKAHGHIRGTWSSNKGEKLEASGEEGRYDPAAQTTELWGGEPRLTRWETATDTAPLIVTADHFVARHDNHTVHAIGNVFIRQEPRSRAWSDEALYDQDEQVLRLWGQKPIKIHIEDNKGKSDFVADKGWLSMSPKRARLIDEVQGHVIPSPT